MNKELAYNFLQNPIEFQEQFQRVLDRTPNERAPRTIEFWVEFFRSMGLTIQNSDLGSKLGIQDVCFSVGNSSGGKILKLAFKINDNGQGKVILRSISLSAKDDINKNTKYSPNEIKKIEGHFFGSEARETEATTINLESTDSRVLCLNIKNNNIQLQDNIQHGQGSSGTNAENIVKVKSLQEFVENTRSNIMLDSILDLISNPKTASKENVGELFSKLIELYKQNIIPGRSTSLEAESHGFTYGLFTLLYKQKYGLDIYVEQSAGKGFLDIAVIFRKMFDPKSENIIATDKGSRIIGEFKKGNALDASTSKAIEQIINEGYNYNLYDRSTEDKIIAVGLNFDRASDNERIKVDMNLKSQKPQNFVLEIVKSEESVDQTKIKDLLKNLYYSIRSEEALELVILGNILSQNDLANKKVFTISQEELNSNTRVTIFSCRYNNKNYIFTITDTDAAINTLYDKQQIQTQELGSTRSKTKANSQSNTPIQTSTKQVLDNVIIQIQKQENIQNGKRIDIVVNADTDNPQGKEIIDKRFEHSDKSKSYFQKITVEDIQDHSNTNNYDSFTKYNQYNCNQEINTSKILSALIRNPVDSSPPYTKPDIEQLSYFKQILFNLKDFIAPYKEAGIKAIIHGLYLENFKSEQSVGSGRADGIIKYDNGEIVLLELKFNIAEESGAVAQGIKYVKYLKSVTDASIVNAVALCFHENAKSFESIITYNPLKADVAHHSTEEDSSPEKQAGGSNRKRPLSSDSDDEYKALSVVKQGKWSECLSGPSSRVKRSDSECRFGWRDVDEFNVAEQGNGRNIDEIKIDSEKFLNHIKNTEDNEKRIQLVQFADEVIRSESNNEEKVVGRFQNLVNKLINNHQAINHLDKVARISGITMYGMMGKHALADFFQKDYEGVAINIGFIAGGQGLAKVSEIVSMKGLKLVSEGNLILGRSLGVASPFLARGTAAFVVYDLVNQVKELKADNKDALVGVIGDSVYLTIDVVEIGVELAEVFGALEAASSATGPVGAAIGAIVFVGTDIYFAVTKVDKIDQVIHLTGWEKFKEGWRAFLGMNPEEYLEALIEEKEINNQLVRQKIEFLKQHPDIQRYVFPTGKSVEDHDHCNVVTVKVQSYPTYISGVLVANYVDEERTICKTKIQNDLDNIILLDEKRTNITWIRAKPDNPSGGEIFCYPEGDYEQVPSGGAYKCKNAIGVAYSENRTGNYTLIDLGKGNDRAAGFPDSPNIFLLGDGKKNVSSGNKNDIFILHGNNTVGYINGGKGDNVIDLSDFATKAEALFINSSTPIINHLYTRNDNHDLSHDETLVLENINSIIGRKNKQDVIYSNCGTKYINSKGGSNYEKDTIIIKSLSNCFHNMQLQLEHNTQVNNYALQGNFSYIIAAGNGVTNIITNGTNVRNNFFFNYTLFEVQNVTITNNNITISFFNWYRNDSSLKVNIYPNSNNNFYHLSDNTEMKLSGENLYAIQNTNKSVDKIIQEYPAIAHRLEMLMVVRSSVSNETVSIGHRNHEVISNDTLHKSHLVGGKGEDIYVITSSYRKLNSTDELRIPETTIYNLDGSNQTDILDLRQLSRQIENEGSLIESVQENGRDVLIKLFIPDNDIGLFIPGNGPQYVKYVTTIRLKDAFENKWYEKLQVILNSAPMNINYIDYKLSLIPAPIVFSNNTQIIVITERDIDRNTELVIPKKVGQYSFFFIENNESRLYHKNLIITNVFDSNIGKENWYTILLSDFYKKLDKMQTVHIKFVDKRITLKDELNAINNAREFSNQLDQYKNNSYSSIFDQMSGNVESHHHRHHHGDGISARRSRAIGEENDFVPPISSSAFILEFSPMKWVKTIGSILVNTIKNFSSNSSKQRAHSVTKDYYDIPGSDTSAETNLSAASNTALDYTYNHIHNNTKEYSPITRVQGMKFIPCGLNTNNQEYNSNVTDLFTGINNSSLLLWDLGIRMFTGVKYTANNQNTFITSDLDTNDYAHRLAYSSYAPSATEDEKDIELLGVR